MSRLPAPAEPPTEPMPMSRRLIAGRLIALMKLIYRSAAPAYRSETRLSDFEWRVITQVGDHGPMVLTALATLLHQDKGQVSHAVTALVRAKLLAREHLRGAISLTKAGRTVFDRIMRRGQSRNTLLVRELTDTERRLLPQLLHKLRANARALLAQEQALRRSLAALDDAVDPASAGGPAARQSARRIRGGEHRLVAQDLFALQNLLQRSAALAFKRETQLSDFEWRVLSQVAEHAPLTLIQLVPLLSRDKSQVGRTLARLEEKGLITREKIGGGRHVLVGISEQGREAYGQLAQLALSRNAALVAGLTELDQQNLMAIFDKLTKGATALAARLDRAS